MKKKIIAAFLTTAMTIGSLSGVTVFAADAGTDEKVEMADASDVDGTTITFWHSMGGVNGEAIDTLVKKFNDENEYGITVDAQYQGEYDDSLNKLKSAQIGNMGADLVQVYEIGTRFMIDSGWNCTAATGSLECSTPMIVPSSLSAVIMNSRGSEAGSAKIEW